MRFIFGMLIISNIAGWGLATALYKGDLLAPSMVATQPASYVQQGDFIGQIIEQEAE